MEFRLLEYIERAITSGEVSEAKASRSPAVWPSEASAMRLDSPFWKIVGKCHRASYFRMTGQPVNKELDAGMALKWVVGRYIEEYVTNMSKVPVKAHPSIFVASGVRLFVKRLMMSLELDIVTLDPNTGRAYIGECKTFDGFFADDKIINKGEPKTENLLQATIYLNEIKTGARLKELIKQSLEERVKLEASGRPHRNRCEANLEMLEKINDGPIGQKLIYIGRDKDANRREMDVDIFQDFDGLHYPAVDGTPYKVFSVESIYERFAELQGYWFRARQEAYKRLKKRGINPPASALVVLSPNDQVPDYFSGPEKSREELSAEKTWFNRLENQVRDLPDEFLPPAEFDYSYSPEKVEKMRKEKLIAKGKYDQFKEGKLKHIGDWQCTYCDYARLCIGKQNPEVAYALHDLLDMEDVEVEIG